MFAGFRSRWMIPCSCAASRASAICFAIGNASSIGIAALRNALREILALDEFHDDEGEWGRQAWQGGRRFEAVNAGDVGMVQRGERLGFAREARQAIRGVRERHG